jgi:hypothetical protein
VYFKTEDSLFHFITHGESLLGSLCPDVTFVVIKKLAGDVSPAEYPFHFPFHPHILYFLHYCVDEIGPRIVKSNLLYLLNATVCPVQILLYYEKCH